MRKGIEAYLTVLIEAFWPKRRIMETYLNIAEWGPRRFGAEAAARANSEIGGEAVGWRSGATGDHPAQSAALPRRQAGPLRGAAIQVSSPPASAVVRRDRLDSCVYR